MADAPRKRPYTPNQLSKEKCFRCGAPAEFQWSACADDNHWRPLCGPCDLQLNVMVVRWLGFKNWQAMIKRYARKIGQKWRHPFTD